MVGWWVVVVVVVGLVLVLVLVLVLGSTFLHCRVDIASLSMGTQAGIHNTISFVLYSSIPCVACVVATSCFTFNVLYLLYQAIPPSSSIYHIYSSTMTNT